jgi:hypothetical protein
VLTVSTDGERLTCSGFSPSGNNSGDTFVGSSHSRPPTLLQAMTDSTEEFFIASSREGVSGLPSY